MKLTHQITKEAKQKGVEITYNKVGNGKKAVFTFVGVGMDGRYFSNYFRENEADYSFFHFQLNIISYHQKEEFSVLWKQFIDALIEENEIEEFSMVAYSIGARLTFPLIHHPKLNQLIFICPDGIVEPLVFKLATQTRFGAWAFHPIFKIVSWTMPSVTKFIKLSSKELFSLWKLYSVFKFPTKPTSKTEVFLAQNDFIISNKKVHKALENNTHTRVSYVKSTHFSILPVIKRKRLIQLK